MSTVNRKAAKASKTNGKTKSKSDSIDVYLRMNEDPHKDYCFSVPTNAPVSHLFKVFDVVPVQLSPSYFAYDKPVGFSVSVHPGYLTAEGALLFTDDSHREKWIKPISNDALIGDVIAEGQLVVPKWKKHTRRHIATIVFLLVWLYLDLPEIISPTPGTAPSRWIYWFFQEFVLAPQPPSDEVSIFNNKWFQLMFFAFHLLKCSFIYLILWNGMWHPNSLNPMKRKVKPQIPKQEQLSEIGWTGARRTYPPNWSGKYLDHRTKRAGGVIEAYRAGELTKPCGYELKEGEGWNVLANVASLDDVEVEGDLLDSDGKFVVSRRYFLELAKPLSRMIGESSTSMDDLEMIKNFRSYGYMDGPKLLQELFNDLIPMHTGGK